MQKLMTVDRASIARATALEAFITTEHGIQVIDYGLTPQMTGQAAACLELVASQIDTMAWSALTIY